MKDEDKNRLLMVFGMICFLVFCSMMKGCQLKQECIQKNNCKAVGID